MTDGGDQERVDQARHRRARACRPGAELGGQEVHDRGDVATAERVRRYVQHWGEQAHQRLRHLEVVVIAGAHECGDGAVVLRMLVTFTARSTGRSIQLRVIEVLEVADGRVCRSEVFLADTAALLETLAAH
jgi:hypothetical protein